MVDELSDVAPKQERDSFWDDVDVDIAYNEGSIEYRDRHYQGSADVETLEWDCCGLWSVFNCYLFSLLHEVNEALCYRNNACI